MDKAYDPQIHDAKWQKTWADADLGRPESRPGYAPNQNRKSFSMVMPPPNVTGVLHQGHALMLALEDTLCRWRRMCGDNVLYLPGTDHASIAVNMQVVKSLAARGVNYRDLGREKFIEECWVWIREYMPRIHDQIKRMGTSCDWSRVKFTMDAELNKAVVHAFVELHKRGLIYRAERLVNWSPSSQTSLSDLEVQYQERLGSLWHLKYPLASGSGFLVVATTRPETMLGDVAVAVNPDDARHKHLIGQKIKLPIVNREIPIIADGFVDTSFGTGAVKITPAHDHTDFEVGLRHGLPRISVLDREAKLVANLPGEAAAWAGQDRFVVRKKVVAFFEQHGLLEKVEQHKNRIGLSERGGEVIEPMLSPQWYVKVDGMAKRSLDVVANGQVDIIPSEFKNQYNRWMEGIHDWCVSRQLWWGQQIPAYHCQGCGHVEVAVQTPKACSKCGSPKFEQDPDVLDTWFSSGLWPFSTLGWPDVNNNDFKKFYPTQVLETGFDILFFWVARMMMLGLEFTGKPPFSKVLLHPMVRDEEGQKMSKTKGNVIDPLEIMSSIGADTLRFTLNALCVQGRDLRLSDDRLETYRNFINKIWNASKFTLMEKPSSGFLMGQRPKATTLHDRYILTRLDATARDVAGAWDDFRMQEAAELLYHFVWNDFCDWYLESVKVTRKESQDVCLYTLGEMLKLLHPVVPHVTEEVWSHLPHRSASSLLAFEVFPSGTSFGDVEALAQFRFLQELVTGVRNLRAENKVNLQKKIGVVALTKSSNLSKSVLEKNSGIFCALAKVSSVTWVEVPPSEAVTRVVVTALDAGSSFELLIPISELRDVAEERSRLEKEAQELKVRLAAQTAKLQNDSFVARAPKEVIDKERLKLSELEDKWKKTEQTLEQLRSNKS